MPSEGAGEAAKTHSKNRIKLLPATGLGGGVKVHR